MLRPAGTSSVLSLSLSLSLDFCILSLNFATSLSEAASSYLNEAELT